MLEKYYNERIHLYPLEASANGDKGFNNLLPADITDTYRVKLKDFFSKYTTEVNKFKPGELNENDEKVMRF